MNYQKPTERPTGGKFLGIDHLHFWVGNAKQAAAFYTSKFGFEYLAYKGLETGSREVVTHVIFSKQGNVKLAFSSAYSPNQREMGEQLIQSGDCVKDVCYLVDNAQSRFEKAVKQGAKVYSPLQEYKDEYGSVLMGSICTYGNVIHTLLERKDYKGPFLPGFQYHSQKEQINKFIETNNFNYVDHVVGNQPVGEMVNVCNSYEKFLDFHRFWSVDDKIIHTEYSSLNSIVMTDFDNVIKMPINEPANGKRKSQIQEYVDYYGGAGVQHIALNVDSIIPVVENMRNRGIEFLEVPTNYYDNLKKNLPSLNFKINEDIEILQKNRILVDYDDKGYLLQIFTKPVEDRPTLFYEIIQRNNNYGFGAGNFKSLFQCIELEQEKRGNLNEIITAKI